jgi:glucose/arabinose dehydrogenase
MTEINMKVLARLSTVLLALAACATLAAETKPLPQAHAHNDYEHKRPLLDALDHGFCSVEADIWLRDGKLLVAHDARDLKPDRTLEALYLDPLRKRVADNNGRVHKNGPRFWLLIDIKSAGEPTYRALHDTLAKYPDILSTTRDGKHEERAITVVISGNRPIDYIRAQTTRHAGIDGRLTDLDSDAPAHLMPMISDRWGAHFKWTGNGPMPGEERKKLREIVAKAHARGRIVRFWATPESPAVWRELRDAKVDLINTDQLGELQKFLSAAHSTKPTTVVMVTPRDSQIGFNIRSPLQVHFSNGLTLSSLNGDNLRLLDATGKPVSAKLGSDIEGDVVNIQPADRLSPESTYTIEVTSKLIDRDSAPVTPFRSSFTTGALVAAPTPIDGFQFTKTKIDDESGPTAIAVGPDGNIYFSTYYGHVYRLRIHPATGLATGKDKLLTLDGRKILGLAFDPESTATNLVAWITYDDRKAETLDVGTFSGVLSKLRIPSPAPDPSGPAIESQYIIGLPSGWHPLNGCTFGPDKRVYISVGSMNRLGHDPIRPETPLSSSVVVADVRNPTFNRGELPLNVQTTAPINYNPHAENAPLKLFATGFRQMYRVCWHSNGNLYGGVNQNDGTGRAETPSRPGVPSLNSVFPDEDLVRIVEGGYYGHPNPSRNQYVLLGGNPTAAADAWEVPEYPVGVQPEPNFNPANLIFNLKQIDGTSADGCTEYTLPGPLNGRLLICFYEGTHTLHTFAFNNAGTAVTDECPILDEHGESMKFAHPLDVAVHPGGRIYVADFGDWTTFGDGGAIRVLHPAAAHPTARATR